MKEFQVGDLVRFDDEYRSVMKAKATVTTTAMATATTAIKMMAPMTYMTNYTKYKNGIALVVDIISNKKCHEHERYDIFKIILNSEVRYLYRDEIRYAKKMS